ncbi:alpha-2-macroglobulin family protein [Mesonia aquimarina]|uniref:alpha-2-macroglobulin family protein n=1 Tax=Mesonia aquimarina TaxID=1504967 RepID=UPI000EF61CDA|nr:MG2 domain-containing protein [Mesonia aquimarina]
MKIRILACICCLLTTQLIFSQQKFNQWWNEVEQLEVNGKSFSAYEKAEKILEKAERKENELQFIKAFLYQQKFNLILKSDSQQLVFNNFEQTIKEKAFPTKQILASYFAESLWKYYQRNYYKIRRRTETSNNIKDFKTWDQAKFLSEIHHYYELSFQHEEKLFALPLSDFTDILQYGENYNRYQSTLLDLLGKRYLAFLNYSQHHTKNHYFIKNEAHFLLPKKFISYSFAEEELKSPEAKLLQLYQKLIRNHLQNNDEYSAVMLSLERLKFVKNNGAFEEKKQLYLQALKEHLKKFTTAESQNLIQYHIAHFYFSESDKEKHPDYFQKSLAHLNKISKNSKSPFVWENALQLKKVILMPEYKLISEREIIPNEASRMLISFRNTDTLQLQIFRVPREIKEDLGWNKEYTQTEKDSILRKYLLQQKSVKTQKKSLPKITNHYSYTTEFFIEGLPVGNYIFCVTNQKKLSETKNFDYGFVQSTNLQMARFDFNDRQKIYVTHRKTGKSLENVIVKKGFSYQNYTDKNGMAWINGKNDYYYEDIILISENDTLEKQIRFREKRTRSKPEAEINSYLFTDRSIYRPGQKVYVKGILAFQHDEEKKVVANENVTIKLYDINRNAIDSLQLKTNEFGSVHGEFTLPKNGLTGRFRIEIDENFQKNSPYKNIDFDNEYRYFQVEEYKRPRFEVTFKKIDSTYVLQDSIQLTGNAEAYFGGNLTDAEVVYTVTRSLKYNRPFQRSTFYQPVEEKIILSDSTKTDASGNFKVNFKAIPDLKIAEKFKPIFTYTIEADVTDVNGETRSAEMQIRVGYHTKVVNLEIKPSPENKKLLRIKATDLNLRKKESQGILKIYHYQMPEQAFLKRAWDVPEIQQIDKEKFLTHFPYTAYDSLDIEKNWPKKLIDSLQIDTKKQAEFSIDSLVEKSGKYQFTYQDQSALIEEATLTNFHQSGEKLLLPEQRILQISDSVVTKEKTGKIRLTFSTELPQLHIFLEFNDKEKISNHQLKLKKGEKITKEFLVPLHKKSVSYRVSYGKNNRFYSDQKSINLPQTDTKESKIEFEVITFRDKLSPGKEETWQLKIKDQDENPVDAELLASMYDASLDQFTSHSWPEKITQDFYRYNFSESLLRPIHYSDYNRNTFQKTYNFYNNNFNVNLSSSFTSFKQFGYDFENYTDAQNEHVELLIKSKNTKGYISGIVKDDSGLPLPGVYVLKNKAVTTQANFDGYFSTKVEKGDSLTFSYPGFYNHSILIKNQDYLKIKMRENLYSSAENVITSYGSTVKRRETLSYGYMQLNAGEEIDFRKTTQAATSLETEKIVLRGVGSINGNAEPLFIVDGVPVSEENFRALNQNDLAEVQVLKDAEATALYGNKGANGVIVITTKKAAKEELAQIETRTNLNETAFFLPQLRTDKKGGVSFTFTSPEALTRWKFQAFAHNKKLQSASINLNTVTQKTLNIIPNFPRFFRSKDTVYISAKVNNLAEKKLDGIIQLEFTDELSQEKVKLGLDESLKNFSIDAKGNKQITWKLFIPERLNAVRYRIVAKAGNFSDGEENVLPVLTNRSFITESLPVWVNPKEEKSITFDALKNNTSSSLSHHRLVFEYTSNPAWTVIKSLPYLIEFPHECAEQTMARFYANHLAQVIAEKNPSIKKQLNTWKNNKILDSDLAKNQALKSVDLSETPWLKTAQTQEEQLHNLATLVSEENSKQKKEESLQKLKGMQLSSGAFPWFKGGRENVFISVYILATMEHLQKMDSSLKNLEEFQSIKNKLIEFVDNHYEIYNVNAKERNDLDTRFLHYLYTRSFDENKPTQIKNLAAGLLDKFNKKWVTWSLEQKLQFALIASRFQEKKLADKILISLEENAVINSEFGMYWKANKKSWSSSPIATQALAIEAFAEINNDEEKVEKLKIWLLRQKKTQAWKSTKATTQAIYALLTRGKNWLADTSSKTSIKLGEEQFDLDKTTGNAGYLQVSYQPEEITQQKANLEIENKSDSPQYGAYHWQYFEDTDKIKSSSQASLHITKKLLKIEKTNSGEKGKPIEKTSLNVGDLVRVQLTIEAKESFSFMHLKDLRAAALEPVDVISTYKWQEGLGYYQSTKDMATHFFFDELPKGTYVFSYDLRVNNSGNFTKGFAELENMYAPEFSARSKSGRLEIKNE